MVNPTSIIDEYFYNLESACSTYLPTPAQGRVREAYQFARQAHEGQYRKSGEPFITHPIHVATSMAKAYMDESSIIAALLHDVAEDTKYTLADIEALFGPQVCHLVDGVTHLKNVSQLQDIAHLFVMMAGDVRVVLIKLYDRLHNMQTLDAMPPDRQARKARETLDIYVPLAAKFGIWELKTQLETLVLRYMEPTAYQYIAESLELSWKEHAERLQDIEQNLQRMLRDYNVPCNTYLAQRNPFSIFMSRRPQRVDIGSNFKRSLRIVLQFDDVPTCYVALGYIHRHYAHMSNMFADYIGNPRDIFYRSLHTTIMVPRYSPVDLRLRTYEFDRLSQIGVIAQLQFAPSESQKQPKETEFLSEMNDLFRELQDPQRFVESVFQDILQKHIVCFTPRGKEIALPRGATVLDFAYRVHSDIGHECRGAVVNGDHVEITYELQEGDHVEIIRQRRGEPYLEWLDETLGYATTTYTKRKIRESLRRNDPAMLIRQGREILHRARRIFNVMQVTAQMLAKDFQLDSSQMLYLQIGNGSITFSDLVRQLFKYIPNLFVSAEREYVDLKDSLDVVGRIIGMDKREMRLAHCCMPQVGDKVIGYINGKHTPIKIHRYDCSHVVKSHHTDHFVKLDWVDTTCQLYTIYLQIEGYDRGGLLRDISIPISNAGANIARLDTIETEYNVALRLKLEVMDQDQFIRIVHWLENLQNIMVVRRLNHDEVKQS